MYLRDLLVRLRAEDAGVSTAIERANRQVDELVGGLQQARAEASGFNEAAVRATGGLAGLLGGVRAAVAGVAADFRQYQPILGGMSIAMSAVLNAAARDAIQAEWATTRARSLLNAAYADIAGAIEAQNMRFRGAINISDWLEDMLPVLVVLGDRAGVAAGALGKIAEKVVLLGGDAAARARVWLYIAQAITTGSAEMLTKTSRFLPVPLIQGEEAVRIARRMRREYSDLTNALILFQAISRSTGVEMDKLNMVMETTYFRQLRLQTVTKQFREEFGRGWAGARARIWDVLGEVMSFFTERGGAEPLGRWMTVFTSILAGVGLTKMAAVVLAKLGIIGTGTVLGLLTGLLPWVVGLGALALVVQDLMSFDSAIRRMVKAAGDWAEMIVHGKRLTEEQIRLMVQGNESLRAHVDSLAMQGTTPEAVAAGANTFEGAWERIREAGARAFVERLWMAGYPLYPTPEIERLGYPAIAAGIFGADFEQYMQRWANGMITPVEALRNAIMRFETGEYISGLEFGILEYYQQIGELQRIKERAAGVSAEAQGIREALQAAIDALGPHGREIELRLSHGFAGLTGQVNTHVTIERGAVNIEFTGDVSALSEMRETIIRETMAHIEAELRRALPEEVQPGVR